MSEAEYLDLSGCADLLDLPLRQLRRLVKENRFADPTGVDGTPYWLDGDVLRWAARQGPPLSKRIPLSF